MSTLYGVLGVSRGASSVEIAAAFRDRLAELKGGDPEAIEAVREAYQTLANPFHRASYDETLGGVPVSRDDDEELSSGGILNSRALKFAVPVVLVAIAFLGWKSRNKPPEAMPASPVNVAPAESPANVAVPAVASPAEKKPGPDQPAAPAASASQPAASPSPPAAAAEPPQEALSMAESIVGRWACRGSEAGRNGEYAFGPDGLMRIVSDGRNFQARYRAAGRRIHYQADSAAVVLDIESIAGDRMVQVVDGERLECERRK